jgi:hypothetical protein
MEKLLYDARSARARTDRVHLRDCHHHSVEGLRASRSAPRQLVLCETGEFTTRLGQDSGVSKTGEWNEILKKTLLLQRSRGHHT